MKHIPHTSRMKKSKSCLRYLGQELKKHRSLKRLSQEQLANEADIGLSYYSRVETGKVNISFCSLLRILKVLDLQLTTLVPNIYDLEDD